jgi:hypothetical protein
VRPRVRATQIQTTLARAVYHWSAGARSAVMNGRKLDSQQVELVGTALLRTHLLADGIELAEPIRDRGVDLIHSPPRSEPKVPTATDSRARPR